VMRLLLGFFEQGVHFVACTATEGLLVVADDTFALSD